MWEDKDRRKKETEQCLKSMPIALMKHFDGSHGMGSYRDGVYRIIKDGTDVEDVLIFETLDALSDAGWTITT